MSLINGTSTSAFLYCTSAPATQTFYTTVYETVLPAACETSQWMATYTITETCAGNPADYVTAVVPPGFVVTTVSCPACNPNEIEITCPGAQPTGMGMQTVAIGGNGVTATITASPTAAPGFGGFPAAPTGAVVPPVATIGNPSCPGCTSGMGGSSGANSSNVSSSSSGSSGSSGSNSVGGESGMGNKGGNGTASTTSTPPLAFAAGASSLTRNLALISGLALVAGHFFLL
ncbi:hypothetical protein F5X99DRAFT_393293 [Biscogniauxia marginata]|nr:hypothetical protein F5X99DRAFT_393293 [Biscogniauxia marginata]